MKISEIKRKTTAGVMAYTLRTGLLYGVAIVATGLLSAFLSPEDFGVYFVVTAVIGIFTFMSDIGLAAALIQKKSEPNLSDLRSTFTVQQMLAFGIFGSTLLLTPFWKSYANLDRYGLELIYALGLSFILASLKTIPSILLERKLKFDKLVIPQLVENLVFYSIAVVLAWKGYGVRSYTMAVLGRSVVGVVVMYGLQSWSIGFDLSKAALRQLLKFGFKFQINDLLARLKDDLYIVVLSRFIPAAEMGYIGWAKRWSMFPYQFSVNSVVAVSFPTYSRLQHRLDILSRAIEKSIFFISLIIFPILAGMSLMALPLVELVPQYAKWKPALPALYFFCINITWAAISTPLTNTLNAIGEINKTLKLMIMWTGLTWLLTPLGLHLFGATGVAIVSAAVSMTSVVTIWMVKRVISIRVGEQLWRQVSATLIMGLVVKILIGAIQLSWATFALTAVVGMITYIIVMLLIGYKKLNDEIRSLLKR